MSEWSDAAVAMLRGIAAINKLKVRVFFYRRDDILTLLSFYFIQAFSNAGAIG